MRKTWKKAREIKETLSLNVSTSGGRPVLSLPKALVEQYDIWSGDRVKVQLRALYKEVTEKES